MTFDDKNDDSKGAEEVPPKPQGGEMAVKEMKKKATFSAIEDEIRVVCLPHLLNIQDYKKPVQWVAKINEVNKEAGEILKLPERTPFGNGDMDILTVTVQHPRLGEDYRLASQFARAPALAESWSSRIL